MGKRQDSVHRQTKTVYGSLCTTVGKEGETRAIRHRVSMQTALSIAIRLKLPSTPRGIGPTEAVRIFECEARESCPGPRGTSLIGVAMGGCQRFLEASTFNVERIHKLGVGVGSQVALPLVMSFLLSRHTVIEIMKLDTSFVHKHWE